MNFSKNNQFSHNQKKYNENKYQNSGYGSSGTKHQFNPNNNYQNNNNNFPPQNHHYPIENQEKESERPLWSYREIKYDKNKEPLNSEDISNKNRKKSEIQKQNNFDNLEDEDKKYFNNIKYQKVKVVKKIKNNNVPQNINIQKKGPVDDYEQQYNKQNFNNDEKINNPNEKFLENHNNKIK